ncbi:MAG: glycoside hydrolase family 36 protein [Armatimonadota bacterium]
MNTKMLLIMIAFVALAGAAWAVTPGKNELAKAGNWAKGAFESKTVPFSFTYGGVPSDKLLATWRVSRTTTRIDKARTRRTVTYNDPKTGLQVKCEAVEYKNFPTVEWTLYFSNTGSTDTPIIENIQAIDSKFTRGKNGEFVLHHEAGSLAIATDYQLFETKLEPDSEKTIDTSGGRPCNTNMPYFNIAWPDGGVIVVVGWPGQWSAKFTRDNSDGLTVKAGQELTHFKLHPGEEVRGPLMAVQFYDGDWIRGQNIWRRWMVDLNIPRPGGKLPGSLWTPCSSHQFGEMIRANTENQKLFVDRYIEEGLKPDYWWMDAGWYVNDGTWVNVGTWEVDTKRFPQGLRAVSDHAHSKDVKIITWFEPERVTKNSWLFDNHPEWLLTAKNLPEPLAYQNDWRLLNLGNPEARKWLTDHVDKTITEQGIDLYRQDFNMDPLCFWRASDTEDRQGITEIGHVTGYLAYWDELSRRHPNMLIDSCASGGRRNDLETLRRAVPFVRSDYLFDPTGEQCHMYGASLWIPHNGTGFIDIKDVKESSVMPPGLEKITNKNGDAKTDSYLFRSIMSMHITPCLDMRKKDIDYANLRKLMNQWREIAPNYLGDYYPLTPYSLEDSAWIAWQFDTPESGEGVVQAFRRGSSEVERMQFKLHGIEPVAAYKVTDLDSGKSQEMRGSDLTNTGLLVTLPEKQSAALITYKKINK